MNDDDMLRALAREHGMDFVDLDQLIIPPNVIELIPELVAREYFVLPMADHDHALKVVMSDPLDFDTREKLQSILNRNIEVALAPRESILKAIKKHYGQVDGV